MIIIISRIIRFSFILYRILYYIVSRGVCAWVRPTFSRTIYTPQATYLRVACAITKRMHHSGPTESHVHARNPLGQIATFSMTRISVKRKADRPVVRVKALPELPDARRILTRARFIVIKVVEVARDDNVIPLPRKGRDDLAGYCIPSYDDALERRTSL